jgi:hypothetical protein
VEKNEHAEGWVWVVVQTLEGTEQYLGQHDEKADVVFIPAFNDKESAQNGLLSLKRQPRGKYEVQAVYLEELQKDAAANGFVVFILDDEGRILSKC